MRRAEMGVPGDTVLQADGVPMFPLDEAAAGCLVLLGSAVTTADLWTGLPRSEGAMTLPLLARALVRQGFGVVHRVADGPEGLDGPCLLHMGGGHYAVVVKPPVAGSALVLADPQTGAVAEVPTDRLFAMGRAEVLVIASDPEAVAERHIGARPAAHWFWRHFRPLRGRFGDIVLASAFANLLAVAVSLFALQVYDRVVPNQNEATLWVLAGGAALAIGLEFLLRMARATVIDRAGRDIELAASGDLFGRLVNMRLDARPVAPGGLVNGLREFATVKEFFAVAAVGVLTDLPFALIFLGVIYAIAGPLVLLVAGGATVMILLSLLFQRRIHRLSRDMLGGSAAALRLLTEAAYGLETLRAHRFAPWFQRNWDEITELNAQYSSRHRRLSAGLSFAATSVQTLTYVGAVTGGVFLFFADELSVGGITAVSILTGRTLAPFVQLSAILSRWKNTTAALEGLEAIARAPQMREAGRSYIRRPAIEGALRLRDVRTAYPGVEEAQLVVADLPIAAGARVALLGENGSGKSLLLRVMAGLYAPRHGSLMIDGLDAQQIDPDDLRRAIGYLPQEPRLFKGTLRENLSVGETRFSDARLLEALDFAGLGKAVAKTAKGLDLLLQDGGEGLSVGQRAAVGLARLHLQDPVLVLLDEPTAAMDSRSEAEFIPRLAEWLKGRGAVICTHRMAMMDVVQDVIVLAEGRVLAKGPKQATLAQFARGGADAARDAGLVARVGGAA